MLPWVHTHPPLNKASTPGGKALAHGAEGEMNGIENSSTWAIRAKSPIPAFTSMAALRSFLSFRSCASLFRRASFLFSSSSSLDCNRLASASTRFLPYLYCSASEQGAQG